MNDLHARAWIRRGALLSICGLSAACAETSQARAPQPVVAESAAPAAPVAASQPASAAGAVDDGAAQLRALEQSLGPLVPIALPDVPGRRAADAPESAPADAPDPGRPSVG